MNKYLRTLNAGSNVTDAIQAVDPEDEVQLPCEIEELLRKNWNKIVDSLNSDELFLCILESDHIFSALQVKRLQVCQLCKRVFFFHSSITQKEKGSGYKFLESSISRSLLIASCS